MTKVRSYADLVDRIRGLSKSLPILEAHQLGAIPANQGTYPFWLLETPQGPEKKKVCLSGGIHGNEPAGVEVVLGFMAGLTENPHWTERFQFTFFPCMNPFGYEYDCRENGSNLDLNRQFHQEKAPLEVECIKQVFRQKCFDFDYECHEDFESQGFYLYESGQDDRMIGEKIIEQLSRFFPINTAQDIEEMPAINGVIRPPHSPADLLALIEKRGGWPQAVYFSKGGTPVCITAESPSELDMADRVKMHLLAFETALSLL